MLTDDFEVANIIINVKFNLPPKANRRLIHPTLITKRQHYLYNKGLDYEMRKSTKQS